MITLDIFLEDRFPASSLHSDRRAHPIFLDDICPRQSCLFHLSLLFIFLLCICTRGRMWFFSSELAKKSFLLVLAWQIFSSLL
jgi:hypothetical protein